MTVPQPFQYQGSKRALASLILQYLPVSAIRLVEPFCGSAALSIATAARGRAKEFWLNDVNAPLAKLLALIVNSPKDLGKFYKELWRADHEDALEHYYQVRELFNRTQDPQLLLYLLARCVKGAVRYNAPPGNTAGNDAGKPQRHFSIVAREDYNHLIELRECAGECARG
jgi:DNA adenine methylase